MVVSANLINISRRDFAHTENTKYKFIHKEYQCNGRAPQL